MSEWLKEHDWKSCVGVTPPWVRIPLSPLFINVVGFTGQNRRARHVRAVGAGKRIIFYKGPNRPNQLNSNSVSPRSFTAHQLIITEYSQAMSAGVSMLAR